MNWLCKYLFWLAWGCPFYFLNSSSKSYQTNLQQSGGTQTDQAGQAVGDNNAVNTGTVTDVNNSRTTDLKFGNNNSVIYGLTADDVATIGNSFSAVQRGESSGGGSGVTLNVPSSTADKKTEAQSKLVKYGLFAAVLLALIAFVFGRKKS